MSAPARPGQAGTRRAARRRESTCSPGSYPASPCPPGPGGLSLRAAVLSPSAAGRSGVGVLGHGAGCAPSQTLISSASPPLQRPWADRGGCF